MKNNNYVVSSKGANALMFQYVADCYPFGYTNFIVQKRGLEGKLYDALPILAGDTRYYILLDSTEILNFLETCVRNNLTEDVQLSLAEPYEFSHDLLDSISYN